MYKVIVSCKGLNANRGTLSKEFSLASTEPDVLEGLKKEVSTDHQKIYGGGMRQTDITVRRV